ncbi:hypothetical protein FRC03_002529 [Tulasnella sp. 419]|nr:hypothetical protein FRC02_009310 [Tulasnella sp. 418]KAG8943384.1 hypothetical protein FRC03_002529 [Tulasnella sp. 419]
MRTLLSSILVSLAILSSAKAGPVSESLEKAGLEACPEDPKIRIHENGATELDGFRVLKQGHKNDPESIVYETHFVAAGLKHCVWTLIHADPTRKHHLRQVMTRRGNQMIDMNDSDQIQKDELLEYGSTGRGQYKWVLLDGFLSFQALDQTQKWRNREDEGIIGNLNPSQDQYERCRRLFRDKIYHRLETLITELEFRSKARIPSGIYFNAVGANADWSLFKIREKYVFRNLPLLEKDAVHWDTRMLSSDSEFPLKEHGKYPTMCPKPTELL